ncbi:MAG: hypothetical protein RRC34_04915 [Lentisphaeria bacterium]|nr:hypothetical protein [Lentisphaeria bacterium]
MNVDKRKANQQIIADIRAKYMACPDDLRQTVLGLLKTVSDDLNSNAAHFILELIQNAEDNAYADGVCPTLRFCLREIDISGMTRICLAVENNETGFEEKHVVKLCDATKSTKTKNQGDIGEKGIGFKSVFQVTDCPYIHSNGFHFCLPKSDPDTGLGYIVPVWSENATAVCNPQKTTIILPLKQGTPLGTIKKALQKIAPETILFLSKLKTIEIEVELPDESYEIVIEKDDRHAPLIELTHLRHQSGQEELDSRRYWVTTSKFAKPPDINPEKRPDVSARTVSVAIPLDDGCDNPGKLFAYLPVWESTGLPFLINADFLLVPSRQDLHEDEPWNLWLRDCIAQIYTEALVASVGNAELPVEQRAQAYGSIPIQAHEPWLEPVMKQIQERLSKTACVLVSHNSGLQFPEVCRWPNKAWRELLAPESDPCPLIREKMFLVHPDIPGGAKNALHKIGVKNLSLDDQLACLGDSEWIKKQGDEWLLRLYSQLRQVKAEESCRLAGIPLVPVCEAGKKRRVLSCDNQQPLYFPLDEQDRKNFKSIPGWLREKMPVAFVTDKFDKLLREQEEYKDIRDWMTRILLVEPFSMQKYCDRVGGYLERCFECLEDFQLVEATTFLVKHAGNDFNWNVIPVLLADGRKLPRKTICETLVVPKTYDPDAGWQHIWRIPEDRRHFVALDNGYDKLPKSFSDKIGAVAYPGMVRIKTCDLVNCKHPEDKIALSNCRNSAAESRCWDTYIETVQLPSLPSPMIVLGTYAAKYLNNSGLSQIQSILKRLKMKVYVPPILL